MKSVVWGVIISVKIGDQWNLPGMNKSILIEVPAITLRSEAFACRTTGARGAVGRHT